MKLSKLTDNQAVKIVKAAVYLGISAAISHLISRIANDPDLFGQLTPPVNLILVVLKQLFTEEKAV